MIGAIHQRHAHIDNGKPERAVLEIFDNTFFDRRDEIARHYAALYLIFEYETRSARQRLDVDVHIAELAVPAGLALVTAVLARRFLDRFLVRHARLMRADLEPVLAHKLFGCDLKMNLALSRQRHLLQLGVLFEMQRGVFFLPVSY